MFDNVGIKIQRAAMIIAGVEIVAGLVSGIWMILQGFSDYDDLGFFVWMGLGIIIGSIFVGWLSGAIIFGFGKLIEDVGAIRKKQSDFHYAMKNLIIKQEKGLIQNTQSAKAKVEKKAEDAKNTTAPVTDVKEIEVNDVYWTCSHCKTKNINDRDTCWSCGKAK